MTELKIQPRYHPSLPENPTAYGTPSSSRSVTGSPVPPYFVFSRPAPIGDNRLTAERLTPTDASLNDFCQRDLISSLHFLRFYHIRNNFVKQNYGLSVIFYRKLIGFFSRTYPYNFRLRQLPLRANLRQRPFRRRLRPPVLNLSRNRQALSRLNYALSPLWCSPLAEV